MRVTSQPYRSATLGKIFHPYGNGGKPYGKPGENPMEKGKWILKVISKTQI